MSDSPEPRRITLDKNTGMSIGLVILLLGAGWYLTDIRFQVAAMANELRAISTTLKGSVTHWELDRLLITLHDLNPELNLKLPPTLQH